MDNASPDGPSKNDGDGSTGRRDGSRDGPAYTNGDGAASGDGTGSDATDSSGGNPPTVTAANTSCATALELDAQGFQAAPLSIALDPAGGPTEDQPSCCADRSAFYVHLLDLTFPFSVSCSGSGGVAIAFWINGCPGSGDCIGLGECHEDDQIMWGAPPGGEAWVVICRTVEQGPVNVVLKNGSTS